MRYSIYLPLVLCLLLFATCKPKDSNTVTTDVDLLLSTGLIDAGNAKLFELGSQNHSTPQQAIMLTAEWLRTQTGVANVYVFDSTIIKIITTDGTASYLQVVLTDADGYSIFRGGGGGSKMAAFSKRA